MLAATLAFQGLCVQAASKQEARALAEESLAILRRFPVGKEMIYALQLLGALADDDAEKTRITQECLAIARTGHSRWWVHVCMIDLSYLAMNRGDYAEARALLEEVLLLVQQENNQAGLCQSCAALSQIAMLEGKYSEARSLALAALTAAEDMGYGSAIWWSHSAIADSAFLEGDYTTAQCHYQKGLEICRQLNNLQGSVFELSGLGGAACGLKAYAEARRYCCDALRVAAETGSIPAILESINTTAGLLAETGEPERAAQLAGFVADQPGLERITRLRNERLLQTLKAVLPSNEFLRAVEQSRYFERDEGVGILIAEMQQVTQETLPSARLQRLADALTERESEVLTLISEGLSNYDIAVRLFLGVSTVKTHINRIFGKLDVKNRTQAVARARELKLL
ncbi:MAG: response regulator transcription factor [Anaerolineae bacterium]|nr:response regulator transcription factor [Anaerolineae bacterium]